MVLIHRSPESQRRKSSLNILKHGPVLELEIRNDINHLKQAKKAEYSPAGHRISRYQRHELKSV